ncbi:cation:proton antiporter [Nitrosarchaeum koreense]|nr:cation:proton antiporter [Nitrosarchaeum koreense]
MEFDIVSILGPISNKILAEPTHSELIVQDFAVIMIIASVMALISFKLKQPMVIAYIAAGMIIGPYTPPFSLITNLEILNVFAEIGIIVLLFVIGMGFPIEKLKNIGKKATIIASAEALGTFALGYFAAQAMGFSSFDSMFVALAISVTSTVIVMRVLEEMGLVDDKSFNLIVGVSIIEDIIIISMLAVIQSVVATEQLSYTEVGVAIGFVLAFIIGAIVVGTRTVPYYTRIVKKTGHNEFILVAMLGLAFGLSVIAFKLGISVATGAFFAGVLVAGTKIGIPTKAMAIPIRDMFAALFFISVGALMDVKQLPLFILPAIALILVSISSKFFTVWISAKLLGFNKKISFRSGIGLSSSGGELALVAAKGGADVSVTSSMLLPLVGTMTIITTFLSPYIIKYGWKFSERFGKDESVDKTSS